VLVKVLFLDDDGADLLGLAFLGENIGLHSVDGEVVVLDPPD